MHELEIPAKTLITNPKALRLDEKMKVIGPVIDLRLNTTPQGMLIKPEQGSPHRPRSGEDFAEALRSPVGGVIKKQVEHALMIYSFNQEVLAITRKYYIQLSRKAALLKKLRRWLMKEYGARKAAQWMRSIENFEDNVEKLEDKINRLEDNFNFLLKEKALIFKDVQTMSVKHNAELREVLSTVDPVAIVNELPSLTVGSTTYDLENNVKHKEQVQQIAQALKEELQPDGAMTEAIQAIEDKRPAFDKVQEVVCSAHEEAGTQKQRQSWLPKAIMVKLAAIREIGIFAAGCKALGARADIDIPANKVGFVVQAILKKPLTPVFKRQLGESDRPALRMRGLFKKVDEFKNGILEAKAGMDGLVLTSQRLQQEGEQLQKSPALQPTAPNPLPTKPED